jgi:hypothetical protein
MRQVREADRLAHGPMLGPHIAVVRGHGPTGDLFKNGAQFCVLVVEGGMFHHPVKPTARCEW